LKINWQYSWEIFKEVLWFPRFAANDVAELNLGIDNRMSNVLVENFAYGK
jgi:hypothetical protein